jgi:Ca2+-transporting ATPase
VIFDRSILSPGERESWMEKADASAREGLRVLAIAWGEGEAEASLTLLGLAMFWDPPRAEVPDAIRIAHGAGIRVIMITGDHPATALSIAHQIGIPGERVMTGEDLAGYQGSALIDALRDLNVFARVRPEQKLQIVEVLQAEGHIVAMTGDGVNDAPALKRSDVGVAMGQRGSDVSREVADLVLLDDNFATIVRAVEEGRGIYDNIQKFLRFLFSTNLSEVLLVAAGALLAFAFDMRDTGGALLMPLTAVQILWINLMTDGLPALAIAFDRTPGVMQQRDGREHEGRARAGAARSGATPRVRSRCRTSRRIPFHGRWPAAADLSFQARAHPPATQRLSARGGVRRHWDPVRGRVVAALCGAPGRRRYSAGALGRRVRRGVSCLGTG